MIPKLTDDAISRLPLESGRAELLEEIMSTVAPDRQTAETLDEPAPRRTRWLVARSPPPRSSPASPAATLWWQQHRPAPDGSDHVAASLGLPEGQAVVLDAPGWKVDSLGGDGLGFRNGDADLEITSYDADQLRLLRRGPRAHRRPAGRRLSRSRCSAGPAQMWAYTPTTTPRSARSRTATGWSSAAQGMDEAAYLALLGQLRLTSDGRVRGLAARRLRDRGRAARPRPARSSARSQAVSGAGFPAGTSLRLGRDGEAKDRYQFGAEVVGAYACAWLEDYENATDPRPAGQADEAAAGARHLARLADPAGDEQADGDYPEVVWELADEAGAGQVPEWYREGLGC